MMYDWYYTAYPTEHKACKHILGMGIFWIQHSDSSLVSGALYRPELAFSKLYTKAGRWKPVVKTLNCGVTVVELQPWPSDLTKSRGTLEGFEWLGRAAHSKQQTHDREPFFIYFFKLQPNQVLEKKRRKLSTSML